MALLEQDDTIFVVSPVVRELDEQAARRSLRKQIARLERGLWIGTPLLLLWVGSQVQGATQSLGTAFATAFAGAVATVVVLAWLPAKLSDVVYRANREARGLNDTGHLVLEAVLVVRAGITVAGFAIWFFLLSGAHPVPVDITL